jgi:hypothetical protein
MRRQDILDSMHLAWEVTQLESPDRDILCMDMYDPILSKLFSLQLEDPQLDEMTNRIEDFSSHYAHRTCDANYPKHKR